MRCGGCNRELAPKLKFCPLCGAPTLALPEGVGAKGMDPGNASLAGRPIREWLDECASLGRDLPLATAVGLLLKILDALTILHERGVVHSEPSPENILVRGDPLAGDLRVTLLIAPDAPSFDPAIPLPANAEMLGAPAWTAPERRTAPETIGPTADSMPRDRSSTSCSSRCRRRGAGSCRARCAATFRGRSTRSS